MILYGDSVGELITALAPLLPGVSVSGRKPSGNGAAVVVSQGPELDIDTINRTFLRVNFYEKDGIAVNALFQRVRAIITTRGGICDGKPFTRGVLNAGPNEIDDETGTSRLYAVFELHLRGKQL